MSNFNPSITREQYHHAMDHGDATATFTAQAEYDADHTRRSLVKDMRQLAEWAAREADRLEESADYAMLGNNPFVHRVMDMDAKWAVVKQTAALVKSAREAARYVAGRDQEEGEE